jgi:hypothetical protein
MEMIRAGQQLSLRGVSGLKGSWLRVSSCDLENRKASTENRRSTGTKSAVPPGISTDFGKAGVREMNRLQ